MVEKNDDVLHRMGAGVEDGAGICGVDVNAVGIDAERAKDAAPSLLRV